MNTPPMETIGWRIILDASRPGKNPMIVAALAGGRGMRFGGGEKCLAPVNGRPMAGWALDAASRAGDSIIIIANRPELYSGFRWPVYPDLIKGMGPLSGLYTAFERTGAQELFLLACDMPRVTPEAITYVISRALRARHAQAVIPMTDGREQGLFAVYRKQAVERHLVAIRNAAIQFDEFRLSLDRLIISQSELEEAGIDKQIFLNVNTRSDLGLT